LELEEYATFDGLGLADLVAKGEVTPLELAQTSARAIERVNSEVNAVVEVYQDRISGFDDKALSKGPFYGVPFITKDGDVVEKGRKIEFGSRLCKGMTSQIDSYTVENLRAAGFNFIGRSNVPEFSRAVSTENSLYGNTSTPWRKGYSAGGSTGGGMAAVVSGIVPIAQGSDLAGSIRIPASWCGGVGLRVSRGRVSAGPAFAEPINGYAAVFAQTKTIRDTAAMLDCMSKPMPGDPFVIPKPEISYLEGISGKQTKLKIGYTKSYANGLATDSEVAGALENTAYKLADAGHEVFEMPVELPWEDIAKNMCTLFGFGFDIILEGCASATGRSISPETVDPITLLSYEDAKTIDSAAYMKANAFFNYERRRIANQISSCDVWLTPTTAHPALPHGRYNLDANGKTLVEWLIDMGEATQYTFPHNIMGTPAISLPLAMHSSGLPIGIQLAAGPANEHLLLGLAAYLEKEMPWINRTPPLHVSKINS